MRQGLRDVQLSHGASSGALEPVMSTRKLRLCALKSRLCAQACGRQWHQQKHVRHARSAANLAESCLSIHLGKRVQAKARRCDLSESTHALVARGPTQKQPLPYWFFYNSRSGRIETASVACRASTAARGARSSRKRASRPSRRARSPNRPTCTRVLKKHRYLCCTSGRSQ